MAQTLFQNPFFRWGMGVVDAIIFVAIAFLLFEDRPMMQLLLCVIAAVGLILTPMILKRATMKEQ